MRLKELSNKLFMDQVEKLIKFHLKDSGKSYVKQELEHIIDSVSTFISTSSFMELTMNELKGILKIGLLQRNDFSKISALDFKKILNTYSRTMANKRLAETSNFKRNENEGLILKGVNSNISRAVSLLFSYNRSGIITQELIDKHGHICKNQDGTIFKSLVPLVRRCLDEKTDPKKMILNLKV